MEEQSKSGHSSIKPFEVNVMKRKKYEKPTILRLSLSEAFSHGSREGIRRDAESMYGEGKSARSSNIRLRAGVILDAIEDRGGLRSIAQPLAAPSVTSSNLTRTVTPLRSATK